MPIPMDRIMRLPAGAELRFGWKIKPEWFDASARWDVDLPSWLPELEGATVNVDDVDARGCRLRLCSQNVCASARLAHQPDGTFECVLQARRHGGGESDGEWSWQRENLSGMLGGKHDAYLAAGGASGSVPFLRLRYSGSVVEVFALSAAFADRLPPMVRSMAPAEIKVGELAPPGFADSRPQRSSPCSCHEF